MTRAEAIQALAKEIGVEEHSFFVVNSGECNSYFWSQPTSCRATTVDQARQEFNEAESGSTQETDALVKWNNLSLNEITAASTVSQVLKAFDRAPYGSTSEKVALGKMITLKMAEDEVAK